MNGCLAFRPRTESATTYKDAAVRRRSVPVTVSSNVHLVFNDVLCDIVLVLVFLVTVAARHALPNIVVQLFPRAGREFHRQIVNIEAKRAFVTQSVCGPLKTALFENRCTLMLRVHVDT